MATPGISNTHFEQVPLESVKKIFEKETKAKRPQAKVRLQTRQTGSHSARIRPARTMNTGARKSDLKYPGWQEPLREALMEFDPHQFKARLSAAETAIFDRLQVVPQTREYRAERQAIEDALNSLRVLKTQRLYDPDWEVA